MVVPPSGGSLEIGNYLPEDSHDVTYILTVPPSGGSLEIGNLDWSQRSALPEPVPPSGGSLEIGNSNALAIAVAAFLVPPSGGSLEIGNFKTTTNLTGPALNCSPFGGIPRNWKLWKLPLLCSRDDLDPLKLSLQRDP